MYLEAGGEQLEMDSGFFVPVYLQTVAAYTPRRGLRLFGYAQGKPVLVWMLRLLHSPPSPPGPVKFGGCSKHVPSPGRLRSNLPYALYSTDQAGEELEAGKHETI